MKTNLLVEPDYKVKYPNLALMKLSTKLKREGGRVVYWKGLWVPFREWLGENDRGQLVSKYDENPFTPGTGGTT